MPFEIAHAPRPRHRASRRRFSAPAPPTRLREVRLGELKLGDEFELPWNRRGGTVVAWPQPGSVRVVLDGDSPADQEARFSPALRVLATGRVSPFYRKLRVRARRKVAA